MHAGFYFLLTVSMIVGKQKNLHYSAFVICYSSTKEIWKQMFGNIIKWSVICSAIYSVLVWMFSALSSYEINNWNIKESMFYELTETLYEGPTILVITAFFVFSFMKTMLGAGILSLMEYGAGGKVLGYFVLLIPIAVEWFGNEFIVFFNLFSISQRNFMKPIKVLGLMMAGLILLYAIYLVGCKLWKEKEFYG